MELLVTADELKLYLDDSTLDNDRAEFVIAIASGEVRGCTGQSFDLVEDDELILDGSGTSVLLLPEVPVIGIAEVLEAQGTAKEIELAGPDADSPEFEWSADGILRRVDGLCFSKRFRWYKVTCDHGYEAGPDGVKAVVLRIVERTFDNPEGMRQEVFGRYSYTTAGANEGVGLYPADRDELAPWTIR